ncbi:hypothetical protein JHK82_044662 [Glycine max]|uniref:Uncharacterized protein n=1 Tax=Glycine max TaxID=3847 RepID=K7MGD0_SOYBN|nr:hypothetical protein JHK87_044852 [Glycine soja]KAG5099610.1 hypothetical protein JHK82_044662 [Glycine max]
MGVLGRDLKFLQRVAEPSAPRDDSIFVVGVGAGRSSSEAQVVMQVRGEHSSPLGHALCTTK